MRIREIQITNFKGCKSATYTFAGKNATISGANGSGKTTIFDAITWLLFGKDSLDNTKFEVRPLDADGKQIDHVEISVIATFDMEDGKTMELKKVQKQNWVKKRGTKNPVLQGNGNEYEVDGYPKSEKDFKEFVNDIVSDDLFKILTNPMYFPNMPWKEQRAVVMKLASKVSDVDMAKKLKKFEPLLDELEKAPSTDDIKAKYQKSINELKKKQTEIPVRIDEANNNKVDIDVAELELQKDLLNEQICEKKSQIDNVNSQIEELHKLSDGIMELKFSESELVRNANESLIDKKQSIHSQIDEKNKFLFNISNGIQENNRQIAGYQNDIESGIREKNRLYAMLDKVESEAFEKNTTICPTCHRQLPEEEIDSLKTEFYMSKAERLSSIKKDISEVEADIDNAKDMLPKIKQCNEDNLINEKKLEEEVADLEKQLAALPDRIDISDTDEYKDIQKQIKEKEAAMSEISKYEDMRSNINLEMEDLRSQLIECEKQIAMSQKNVEIDERISELQAELKEVGVKIASQEKIQYLLDEFIKYKLNKISSNINSMFDGVNFKLFDIQLNGGVKEVCECTVNGIPYGSLNNGHRIVAGLQIIKALQKMYGVYLPIFIDNAESLNDFNIPNMNCQLIKLKVADNKDLRIEVE